MSRPLYSVCRVVLTILAFWIGLPRVSQAQQTGIDEDALARAVSAQNQRVIEWAERGDAQGTDAIADTDPLVQSLRQRAEALERLVELDPAEALRLRLPDDVARPLRARVNLRPLVERFGTWKAPVEVIVEDRFDLGTSRTIVNLMTETGELGAYFTGSVPELECGQHLTVEGMGIGEAIAVTNAVAGEKGASGGCSVFGEQRIAVILANFPGHTLPTYATPTHFENVLFSQSQASLRGFWEENSDGQTWATGDVFGPYTVNPNPVCSSSQIRDKAIQAADDDINFNNYTRVFVIFPDSACGFWGLGSIGCTSLNTDEGWVSSSMSWISVGNGDDPASYMVGMGGHEAGHNMGLRHANSLEFGNLTLGELAGDPAYERCEYGGIYSIMGVLYGWGSYFLNGHYTAAHKAQLGWLPLGSGFLQVETDGTYWVRPVVDQSGIRGLRFRRGAGNNLWLWIEYRQFAGDYEITLYQRSGGSIFNGALVHYEEGPGPEPYEPRLLDFRPGVPSAGGVCNGSIGSSDFHDVTLLPGTTWSDPYTNSWLRVDSEEGDKLRVSMGYGTESCGYSLGESAVGVGVGAGSDSVSVTAGSGCGWNAVSNDDWLSVSAPTYDAGNGSLAFSFAANPGESARIGTISMADKTLTVTQAGAGLPDLQVTSLTGPASGDSGGTVIVSATVEEQEGVAAGSFDVAFYFSANAVLDAGDARSTTVCSVSGLSGGATDSTTCANRIVAVPGSLSAGNYTLFATVDDLDSVEESNEANNNRSADSGTISFSVSGCPANILLDNQTLSGAQTLQATTSATLGSNLIVDGTDIVVRAPSIMIGSDTTIGGGFSVSTTPSCP